jgi:hypothetical protein
MGKLRMDKTTSGLAAALVLCFIGALGSNVLQTNFGAITKKTIQFDSVNGHLLSADLFIPKSATAKLPAPVIVWAHGGNSNKERSDAYQIEWARRGYVVLAIDLYSHGDSEILNNGDWFDGGRGVYDAVKYALSLPYVDKNHVAISGMSRGGNSCHESILLDNEADKQLISAVFYVGRDAVYRDNESASFGYYPGKVNTQQQAQRGGTGEYYNFYGGRSVGILANKYDDYSFKERDPSTGRMKPNPRYYASNNAKSFVNFGVTPDAGTPDAVVGQWYQKQIDGRTAKRIIYMPAVNHTLSIFVPEAVSSAVDFFTNVFPSNTTLKRGNIGVSLVKSFFSMAGFAGFFIFLVFFTLRVIKRPFFSVLQSSSPAKMRPVNDRTGNRWLWTCLILTTLLSLLCALLLFQLKADKFVGRFFNQVVPFYYAMWGSLNGIMFLAIILLWYFIYAKKHNITATLLDISMNRESILKTILLGIYVSVSAYIMVFAVKYFFNTDFRFLIWGLRPITAERLVQALKLLPFFVFFYVVNSLVINSMNFSESFGKSEKGNIWLMAGLNLLPPLLLCDLGYVYFMITGINGLYPVNNQIPDWMSTPLFLLFITPFITRSIYKQTRNPYLGGIINGIIVTLMTCATTQTTFPFPQ